MQHSPAEYFVKYLSSRPGVSLGEVQNYVAGMGLGIMPYDNYINDIYSDIQKSLPPNYNPRDRSHKPSQKFLKENRIRGMYEAFHSTTTAIDLFNNAPVRERIEALVLTGMDDENLMELLTYFYGNLNITSQSIAEFRHYFWNVDLLTYEDWSYYLSQPSIQPVKLTALKSPKNPDGVRLTLYKMGIMPKSLDKMQIFTSMRDIGYMNFLEGAGMPQGRHKAEMLSNYANIVRSSQDKLDEYSAGEQDVINEFYKHTTIGSAKVKHKTLSQIEGEVDEGLVRKLPSGSK